MHAGVVRAYVVRDVVAAGFFLETNAVGDEYDPVDEDDSSRRPHVCPEDISSYLTLNQGLGNRFGAVRSIRDPPRTRENDPQVPTAAFPSSRTTAEILGWFVPSLYFLHPVGSA